MPPIVRRPELPEQPDVGSRGDRRRFLLLWVAPILVLLLGVCLPLISGAKTLYIRDVLNTHYPMKWTQAQAMREGTVPMVDLLRGGGQAHLGNPNTVPLYPDNLLLFFADPLWTVNAHFWIHWLLAPFAGYWLGRTLGMRREGAWALGVVYSTSGFFMSTLNLYNMIAPLALIPAMLAAALQLARPERRARTFAVAAALWGLMILGGEPMTAAFALLTTVVIVAVCHGRRYPWLAAVGAVALGTGLAAPQWVEFLRILSFSYRGHWGFILSTASLGGWGWGDALDLMIPFFYGIPNLTYWGRSLHADTVPLFLSFYPGMLVVALMASARSDGRKTIRWAWGLVGVSFFLALGESNPVVVAMSELPGAQLLRIPSKLWSLLTLGSAVLCGLAFDRLFSEAGRKTLVKPLVVLAAFFLFAWGALSLWPPILADWAGGLFPDHFTPASVKGEQLRWAGTCFLTLGLIGFYLLCLRVGKRRAHLAALALLVAHCASQLFILRPLVDQDGREFYAKAPPLPISLPAGSRVTHGSDLELFGPGPDPVSPYPNNRTMWRERVFRNDLLPPFGKLSGLRYEFNLSPEGLDGFMTRTLIHLMWGFEDDRRLKLLEISGVEYLLLNRELDESVSDRVHLAEQIPSQHGDLRVYRVLRSPPGVHVVGRVRGSANVNEGLDLALDPLFDPNTAVVLAGEHDPWDGAPGTAQLISETADSVVVEASAPNPGVLVVHRTHLPIYRATIDGEPAAMYAANLHHTAVKIPEGTHTVEIQIDRSPFHWSLLASALCLIVMVLLAWRGLPGFMDPRGESDAATPETA